LELAAEHLYSGVDNVNTVNYEYSTVRLEGFWVPPTGQTDKWKALALKPRVKAEHAPKWAHHTHACVNAYALSGKHML
jgi:hypothetical protein